MEVEKLDWDSKFFGYFIGKTELRDFHDKQYEELLRILLRESIKLTYVYPLDLVSRNTLLSHDVVLADTKVTFKKSDKLTLLKSSKIKSFDSKDKTEKIINLALLSGEYSRFRTDKNFINNEYLRLYTEWINKSLTREIASDVIIYKEGEEIRGFVTCKIVSPSEVVIGLIAVDQLFRGRGIGKLLMQSVENIAIQNNIKTVSVSTQLQNNQSMAFYESCGYQVNKQQEIFHLWIR